MEDDVAGDDRGLNTNNIANVLQNDKPIRQILPEKSRIEIQLDHLLAGLNLRQILPLDRNHWEGHVLVAIVGVEHSLQVCGVANLSFVHGANSILHGHDLVQVDLGIRLENGPLDGLNFIVQCLDLISTPLIQVLIQQWNLLLLENLVALLRVLLEEAGDAARVNNLVARAQGQVQEGGDGHAGHEEGLRESIADIVDLFNRVRSRIQRLLRTDDPDVLAVVDDLADEGNVLEAENSEALLPDQVLSEDVVRLPIKGTLPKD